MYDVDFKFKFQTLNRVVGLEWLHCSSPAVAFGETLSRPICQLLVSQWRKSHATRQCHTHLLQKTSKSSVTRCQLGK